MLMPPSTALESAAPLLVAQQLRKSYSSSPKQPPAVDGVSLQLRPGELLGLLGPNGAGKSTLVAMLCGLTAADSGQVHLGSMSLLQDAAACKRRIGLVTQELALFEELSALDNLATFGALYGLKGNLLKQRTAQVLQTVGLAERAGEATSSYSGGMKRRLHIACALLHNPDVLLLDEPTAGVDPQSRHAIFECLLGLKAQGKALLYTTHYIEEVEKLADRILIIDAGRVVAAGSLSELMRLLPPTQRLEVEIDDGLDARDPRHTSARQAQRACLVQAGITDPQWLGDRWQLATPAQQPGSVPVVQRVIEAVHQAGWQLRRLSSENASLEDLFLHITGRQLRD